MFKKQFKKGFSLVELLVVITIIAILSVVAYTAVGGHTIKARDSKRKQDIGTIQQTLELYFAEKGIYPSAPLAYGLNTGEITKKHLSEIPTDPSGGSYIYTRSGTTEYEIAVALEIDGDPAKFKAYVVGNADVPITKSVGGISMYLNGAEDDLLGCLDNKTIISGTIGKNNDDNNCIPYDPRP